MSESMVAVLQSVAPRFFVDLLDDIRADLRRYIGDDLQAKAILRCIYSEESFVFLASWRAVKRIQKIDNPVVRQLAKLVWQMIIHRMVGFITGIYIDPEAEIGKGFYIGHSGGIWVGASRIGNNCNISNGVMIGLDRDGGVFPSLDDYVFVGPHAVLFGPIEVGRNVSIGANSVVSKSIPENAVVVGNPGRIVKYQEFNPKVQNVDSPPFAADAQKSSQAS